MGDIRIGPGINIIVTSLSVYCCLHFTLSETKRRTWDIYLFIHSQVTYTRGNPRLRAQVISRWSISTIECLWAMTDWRCSLALYCMSGSAGGRCSGMRSSSLTAAADLDMAFVPSPGSHHTWRRHRRRLWPFHYNINIMLILQSRKLHNKFYIMT